MSARDYVAMTTGTLPQFGGTPPAKGKAKSKAPTPQIRLPSSREPNKTELAYKGRVQDSIEFSACTWLYEAITLRLRSGTIYTPDWTVWRGQTLVLCIEVKGAHIKRDASKEKFKQAIADFPHLRFEFAQLTKAGWACITK